MSRAGVATTWLVVLCQLAHGLTFTAIPLLLPLVRADLGISFTEAGMLSAVATLSYALGQIPAGFLADRFGPRRPFFIGLIGWSALSLGFGLIHVFWLALVEPVRRGCFSRDDVRAGTDTSCRVVSTAAPRDGDEPLHGRRVRRQYRVGPCGPAADRALWLARRAHAARGAGIDRGVGLQGGGQRAAAQAGCFASRVCPTSRSSRSTRSCGCAAGCSSCASRW